MTRIFNAIKALFRGLWSLIKRWPVRAQGIVVASLTVATAFGLSWSVEQVGAVVGLTSIVLMFITEQAVTPLSEPTLAQGTTVMVTTPAGEPNRIERI